MRSRRKANGATALFMSIVVTFLIAACIGQPGMPAAPPPSVGEVLTEARQAAGEVFSYRFTFEISSGPDPEPAAGVMGTGAWSSPGNLKLSTEDPTGGEARSQESVLVDGTAVTRLTGTEIPEWLRGEWREEPPELAAQFAEAYAPQSVLPRIDEAEASVERGTLHDRAVYIVTAEQDAPWDEAENGTSNGLDPPIVTTTIYVDVETYLPLRRTARTEGLPLSPDGSSIDDPGGTGWTQATFDFHDFNKPVDIEIPEEWQEAE